jgi:hypothetical protein
MPHTFEMTTDRTNVSQREPPETAMRSTYSLEASRAPYVLEVTRSRHPAAVNSLQPARLNGRTREPNSEDGVTVPGTQEQRGGKLEGECTWRRDAIAFGPQKMAFHSMSKRLQSTMKMNPGVPGAAGCAGVERTRQSACARFWSDFRAHLA